MGRISPDEKHAAFDLEKGSILDSKDAKSLSEAPTIKGEYVMLEEGEVPELNKQSPATNKKPNKKSPKPPRPPRSLSLSTADEVLIKEISELVMLKRARIERLKALKKMRDAKSPPSSSYGNFFATFVTILFCLAVIFHGKSMIPAELLPFRHIGFPFSGERSRF